jgi:type IV secretion system protein VirB1
MILAFPAALALAHQCAPSIAPEAILSIVSVESAFDPLAINVDHVGRFRANTADAAAVIATRWISAGYSVDLGLAQINSNNLGWTHLSIAGAFDACANLAAAAKVLQLSYAQASHEAQGLDAISRTFSLYNSGNSSTGFRNNYVARVWRAAGQVVAQIAGTPVPADVATLVDAGARQADVASLPPSFVVRPGDGSVLIFK